MHIWLFWSKGKKLMIYFNDYFIRNLIWSSLIHFEPFWTDQKIDKVENLIISFNDCFIRNLIWSSLIDFQPFSTDLIQSDQKRIGNWKSYDIFQCLFYQKSNLIKFDPFWSNLDRSDPIRSKINGPFLSSW